MPTAVFLFTVWLLHSRHHKRDLVEQLVLPASALLVLACTVAGPAAVPAAGLVCGITVTVGVFLSTRQVI